MKEFCFLWIKNIIRVFRWAIPVVYSVIQTQPEYYLLSDL